MATTEPVTDAAAVKLQLKNRGAGPPTAAQKSAKERKKRDPVAQIEHDTSLDRDPTYVQAQAARVPKPPAFRYGTDQPSPRRPEHFFQWWVGLPKGAKDATIAYIYRNYPVIGVKTPDAKSPTGYRISSQIDKRAGSDPLTSLDDLLHNYGSGDYTIRFNQTNPSKAVCFCVIKGLRDEQHPPVVPLDTLVIEDPTNKPYIEGLRMKGIRIPGVDPINEEDQVGTAAVSQLVGTVERMMDRNAELSARANQREQPVEPPKPADGGAVAKAFDTAMAMMSASQAVQNKMLTDAVTKVQEVNAAAANPMTSLTDLAKVLKELMPQPAAASTALTAPAAPASAEKAMDPMLAIFIQRSNDLEKRLFDLQAGQMTYLQAQLTQSQAAPAVAAKQAATPAGSPTTPLEMLKELVKLKDGLGSLTGSTDREDNPTPSAGGPWWASLLQQAPGMLQSLMGVMAMYSQASYNNALARVGPGQPGAAPMLPSIPMATPAPTTDDNAPGVDDVPLPPPANSGTVLPQPGDPDMNAYHLFLSQLEQPLLQSLNNNETGDEFAEKLIGWQGQVAYDFLHGMGKENLIRVLATYRPIWQVVVSIPAKFEQFLDEFLSYGTMEQPSTPAPVAAPARAPAHPTAQPRSTPPTVEERMDQVHAIPIATSTKPSSPPARSDKPRKTTPSTPTS